MKNPWLAFTLSFILPGAGLWYLGQWSRGAINLGTVIMIGLATLYLPNEVFDKTVHYILFGCAVGSGGLAHALASRYNRARRSQGE